jgi:hypothetical protein
MKKLINLAATALSALALPLLTFAQNPQIIPPNGGPFGTLLTNILGFSNNVLIPFILGIGFLVFVWGMFKFFIYGGADDDAKTSGKSLMVWATLGFVIIIIFWGVINLLASSTGLDNKPLENVPSAVGINP